MAQALHYTIHRPKKRKRENLNMLTFIIALVLAPIWLPLLIYGTFTVLMIIFMILAAPIAVLADYLNNTGSFKK